LFVVLPKGFRGLLTAEGASIKAICDSLGPAVPMDHQGPLIQTIAAKLCETDALGEGLAKRRVWRDERLALLAQLKQRMNNDGDKTHQT